MCNLIYLADSSPIYRSVVPSWVLSKIKAMSPAYSVSVNVTVLCLLLLHSKRLCIKPGIQKRGAECREHRQWRGGRGGCYIPGNVAKPSGECHQIFWGMSSNIPGNVAKHSMGCPQLFRGMSSNIPANIRKHSGECPQTFQGMLPNNQGNVLKHSGECLQTTLRIPSNINCCSKMML